MVVSEAAEHTYNLETVTIAGFLSKDHRPGRISTSVLVDHQTEWKSGCVGSLLSAVTNGRLLSFILFSNRNYLP